MIKVHTDMPDSIAAGNSKKKLTHGVLLLLFFGAICLLVRTMAIYERTIIPLSALAGIAVISGLIGTVLFRRILMVYGRLSGFLQRFVYCLVTFGGLMVFLFLWINEYCRDESIQTKEYPIISRGYIFARKNACKRPYLVISSQAGNKRFVFRCDVEITADHCLLLEASEGAFGFDVVEKIELMPCKDGR